MATSRCKEDARPFTRPWAFGDTTFSVDGNRIYVNSTTLTMSSEVFRAMLTSDFKEKTMRIIPLPDKKFDDFLQLMQILHPHINKFVDDTNVDSILPLAHEYQIHNVLALCEKVLTKQHPSIHNLVIADRFSLPELRAICLDYAKRAPHSMLQKHPEFKMVEKDSLFEIFQHKTEVYEGNKPSKKSCNLMSQSASIETFLQAKQYDVPAAYVKGLKYLKDTPWRKLRSETGFGKLTPKTLNEILTYKVEKLEGLKKEVGNITSGAKYRSGYSSCSGSDDSDSEHNKGEDSQCSSCIRRRYRTIHSLMKRY